MPNGNAADYFVDRHLREGRGDRRRLCRPVAQPDLCRARDGIGALRRRFAGRAGSSASGASRCDARHDRFSDRVLGRAPRRGRPGADQHAAAGRRSPATSCTTAAPRRWSSRRRCLPRPLEARRLGRVGRVIVSEPDGTGRPVSANSCRPAGAEPAIGRMLARRGRLLALFLGFDRRAEGRAARPFEPARHRRHLCRPGARDRARRSGVLGGQAVLRLRARQFDDLSDGGRRRLGAAARAADPRRGARDDAAHRPTIFAGVPTLYAALLAHPRVGPGAGSDRLRRCISAGEPLPEHVGRRWRETVGVRHPRRARLDRDAAHLPVEPARTTSATAPPASRCRAMS